MNKFLITALVLTLATPALAQGMAAGDSMSGPSHMANDSMKMDHKKPAKKTAMKHDAMGTTGGMAHDGMTGPAASGGMAQGSMSGPGH